MRAGLSRHVPPVFHGCRRRAGAAKPRDRLRQGLPRRVHGRAVLPHRGHDRRRRDHRASPACLTIRSRWPSADLFQSPAIVPAEGAGAAAVSCKKIRRRGHLSLSRDQTRAVEANGEARREVPHEKVQRDSVLILRLRCASLRMTSSLTARPGFSTRESRALRRRSDYSFGKQRVDRRVVDEVAGTRRCSPRGP